jgi:hypothetical protein
MAHLESLQSPATAPGGEPPGQGAGYDRFWQPLLRGLRQRKVVPIIGQDLLTVPGLNGDVLYHSHLAERLAAQLGVSPDGLSPTGAINEVVLRYLESEERPHDLEPVYGSLFDLIAADTDSPIPEPLQKLAAIDSFRLFVTTTFDPLLARALRQARPHEPPPVVIAFTTRGKPLDLPEPTAATVVYQLLGGHESEGQDFAVTEEDLLEFLHVLHRRPPERLFQTLENSHLLLVGSSFSDWLARFFIRLTTRDDRPSRSNRLDFIADPGLQSDPRLRLFLKHFCRYARTYSGTLQQFVEELYERAAPGILEPAPPEPQPESRRRQRTGIFLSYAREDLATARAIRRALEQLQVAVWMDETKLEPGTRFGEAIERAIERSLLFIPLVSAATLAAGPRFFKQEWRHALEYETNFLSHEQFIVPVVIDGTALTDSEWRLRAFNALSLSPERTPAVLAAELQRHYRGIQSQEQSRRGS